MFCTQNSQTTTCDGDSGGPLIIQQGEGVVKQIGIVSWGPTVKCDSLGGVKDLTVFTRLSMFFNWIQTIVEANGQVLGQGNVVISATPADTTTGILNVGGNSGGWTSSQVLQGYLSDVIAPVTTLPKPTIQQQEAAALLSFKNSMQDDSDLLSWKGDNACSGWIGIDCTFDRVSNISLGDVAWNKNNNQYQPLTQTPLISIEVATSVPNEWSILQNLVKIQMGKIGLTGTLPSWFSLFTRLEVFYMDDGYFSGSLPEEYSTLEDMVVFIVDNNQLTGTLPVSYTTWNKIGWIDANENRLIGSVPQEYSSLKEGANMLSVFPSTDTNFCTPSANLVTDSIESVVIC
eukprot:TRINITY_DN14475_c0_g1_i7.p1 TRINITY_DN14475_c0_g1~~TRINITY_DN14475_c0_g1_i7.p1  ORF type:complete len:369 (+),score=58.07 TRINITY_DN14475_c0_g1_i7:74-1108(+)